MSEFDMFRNSIELAELTIDPYIRQDSFSSTYSTSTCLSEQTTRFRNQIQRSWQIQDVEQVFV